MNNTNSNTQTTVRDATWTAAIEKLEPIFSDRRRKMLQTEDTLSVDVTISRSELDLIVIMLHDRLNEILKEHSVLKDEAEFWRVDDLAYYLEQLEDSSAKYSHLLKKLEAAKKCTI